MKPLVSLACLGCLVLFPACGAGGGGGKDSGTGRADSAPGGDAAGRLDGATTDGDPEKGGDGGELTQCGAGQLAVFCDSATEICVQESQGIGYSYRCAEVPAGCEDDRSCDCLGDQTCEAPADTCSDAGDNTITCDCLECA